MKYFKLDNDKREIIIDKYKKYNVNIDILDLIIDLKCENDRLNNIIDELEKWLIENIDEYRDMEKDAMFEFGLVLDKLKALKEDNK